MSFRMIQAVIKCFDRSTVERIEENSNDVSHCLFIRLVVSMGKSEVLQAKFMWKVLLCHLGSIVEG